MTNHDDARNALATIEETKKYAASLATFSMETTKSTRITQRLLISLLDDAASQLDEYGFPVFESDSEFGSVSKMIDASLEDFEDSASLVESLKDYFHRVTLNAESTIPTYSEEMREHSTHWGL